MSDNQQPPEKGAEACAPSSRRSFIGGSATAAMVGGLAASYGTIGVYAGRFLFPTDSNVGWQFVCVVEQLTPGESIEYTAPSGIKVVVARHQDKGVIADFVALSSVCPHLGCKVHWESQNDRFFCPCHNGAFDPQGNPTEGPPAQANQSLLQYPLKIVDGLLYIEVPLASVGDTA